MNKKELIVFILKPIVSVSIVVGATICAIYFQKPSLLWWYVGAIVIVD